MTSINASSDALMLVIFHPTCLATRCAIGWTCGCESGNT
jgi:hypothetical protein